MLHNLDTWSLSDIWHKYFHFILQIVFFPFLMVYPLRHKSFWFWWSPFYLFCFIVCAFGVIYKKLLPNPLGIYPEETKIEKDTWTPVFIAALFTIARTWKQPRCPLTDEWIKKLWNTMEYYSHKKKCIWVSSNEVGEPRAYYTE